MDTGIIYVDGQGNLKSRLGGSNVSIFINGVPADETDLATFWPQNAVRVEYMYSSSDPKFRGATNIVNFIMKEYEAGGLTKLQARQKFPNSGIYSASSKLEYKRMSYNVFLKGGYSRDHSSSSETVETFDDVWYQGNHYDRTTRSDNSFHEVSRSNDMSAGFNAGYRTDKVTVTYSASLGWNQNPGSYTEASLVYSPEIIGTGSSRSSSRSRTMTPSIDGNYFFTLNDKWSMSAYWGFQYSRNNYKSGYEERPLSAIDNLSKENAYALIANLWAQYRINSKMAVSAWGEYGANWFFTDYYGYTSSRQRQRSNRAAFFAVWRYDPARQWSITVAAQATCRDWSVNHSSNWSEWRPGVTGYVSYTINDNNSISLSGGYQPQSVPNSSRTDLILRQTELKWIQGNIDIHTPIYSYVNIGYNFSLSNIFNLYAGVDFTSQSSSAMLSYASGGVDYDGVIARYENAGRENRVFAQFNPSVNLFGRALTINVECLYDHIHYTKSGHADINYFQISPGVSTRFGNNMLWLAYRDRSKKFANGGSQVLTNSGRLTLMYTFGCKNLNVSVTFDDILNQHSKVTVAEINGPYSMTSTRFGIGRSVSAQLTYTFDYGKKVNPRIEIQESNSGVTSVLGSGK